MTDTIIRDREESLGAAIFRALVVLDRFEPALTVPREPKQIRVRVTPHINLRSAPRRARLD